MTDTSVNIAKYIFHGKRGCSREDLDAALEKAYRFLPRQALFQHACQVKEKPDLPKNQLLSTLKRYNKQQLKSLLEEFVDQFALYPTTVENFLGCTRSERKRWQQEKKLKIVGYREFDYGEFPVFDCLSIVSITPATLEKWRKKIEQDKAKKKKEAVKKAQKTKKLHEAKRAIVKFQYEVACQEWAEKAPDAIWTLKLAYWTIYASRWAKTYQLKARKATKYEANYLAQKEIWYDFKNQAIAILACSPYAQLGFYRPENPDKIYRNYYWCDEYEIPTKKKFEIINWDDRTGRVKVAVEYGRSKDYYSLYCLTLLIPGIKETFSFHSPFDVAFKNFPPIFDLPFVEQQEAYEGVFRFGRELSEDEMITHSEKLVRQQLEHCLENFSDYNLAQAREHKWNQIHQEAILRRTS